MAANSVLTTFSEIFLDEIIKENAEGLAVEKERRLGLGEFVPYDLLEVTADCDVHS